MLKKKAILTIKNKRRQLKPFYYLCMYYFLEKKHIKFAIDENKYNHVFHPDVLREFKVL